MYKTINKLQIGTSPELSKLRINIINILNFYNQLNYYLINEEIMYNRIVNLVNESEKYLNNNELENSLNSVKKAKNLLLTLDLNTEQNQNILVELNTRIDNIFFNLAKSKIKTK